MSSTSNEDLSVYERYKQHFGDVPTIFGLPQDRVESALERSLAENVRLDDDGLLRAIGMTRPPRATV